EVCIFFFQAEDGIRDLTVTGVQTCALPIFSGPPCTPGKTLRSRAFAYDSRHSTRPPRGPRRVLCVVVVTKSASATGFGWRPAAKIGRASCRERGEIAAVEVSV